ncbi:DUF2802 domain-containing protein [Burkholderiaceae bacterium DAT-1]|nr:DUF2802 domain-containing protein [Burkholderiaceae bacterium DAT-1]
MSAIVISWTQLIVLAVVLVAVYVAEGLWFANRMNRRSSTDVKVQNGSHELMRQELNALRKEVQQIKSGLTPVSIGVHHQESAKLTEEPSAYNQAIVLARQGLDPAAVAAGCGISRGEAELIIALYRSTRSS